MKLEKLESTLYLVRMNLYWNDELGFHDFREAEVVSIENGQLELRVGNETFVDALDGITELCEKLCEQHWSAVKTFVRK